MREILDDLGRSSKPYLSLYRVIPGPIWVARVIWLGVGLILAAVSVFWGVRDSQEVFIRTALPLSLGVAILPGCLEIGFDLLREWFRNARAFVAKPDNELAAWIKEELSVFSRSGPFVSTGLVFILWALFAYYAGGFFSGVDMLEGVFLLSLLAFAAFLGGVGICSLVCVANIVRRIGEFPIIVERHSFGVLSTGRMLTQVYLIGALLWLLYALSATAGFPRGLVTLGLIAAPVAATIVVTFVISQVPLHRAMMESKRMEAHRLRGIIDELKPKHVDDLTEDAQRKAEFFRLQLEAVVALPEWPIRWRAIVGVVSSWLASSLLPAASRLVFEAIA